MSTPTDIPIMVFFGTKGGVGKTTITSKFSEFVSYGKGNPNVLMIDLDVDHRGLTVLWTKGAGFSCKTIHDYMLEQSSELDKLIDVSDFKQRPDGGKLFLIPSAHKESSRVFQVTAGLDYETLVNTLIELIKKSIDLYDISFIVIDCGPVINPYTAAAAHIADHAFIIGQNEPISYQSLANYPFKIKEFYQDFNSSKMSVILNKVRGIVQERDDILAVIPFTIDIIDFSEGLEGIDEYRLALFDSHIKNMISKLFKHQENYIPEYSRILPPSLSTITPETNKFRKSKEYKGLKMHRIIFPVTISLLALFSLIKIFSVQLSTRFDRAFGVSAWTLAGLGVILIISFFFLRKYNGYENLMNQIEQGGGETVAQLLQTQQGRAILNKFKPAK